MLRLLHDILGYKLDAKDDEFGRVKDFLFDDDHWTVRYLVADTGRWIPKRKVLISPAVLDKPDWEGKDFPVNLTREEIEQQPDLGEAHVVTRNDEWKWYAAYGYPYYYMPDSAFAWGIGAIPVSIFEIDRMKAAEQSSPPDELKKRIFRSLRQIHGYSITSGHDALGTVDDLVMDDETWTIRYIKVDAHPLDAERMLLLAPQWLDAADWQAGTLNCRIPRDEVYSSPGFHPDRAIERSYEHELHAYYREPAYWNPSTMENI